jgi:hypothetical protein
MAQDGRWTGGEWGGASNRRVVVSTMGNRPATTRGRGAEGEGGLGEDDPDRWAPSASDCGAGNRRQAGSRVKMG